jgi:inorganic pyrophosphatase
MLKMSDEAGSDEKLIVIPSPKVFPGYAHINDMKGVSPHWLERIGHFFEHYKDLEKGKWVKVDGWVGADEAKAEIVAGIERYTASKKD